MIKQDNTLNDETMIPKNASHKINSSNNAEVDFHHFL